MDSCGMFELKSRLVTIIVEFQGEEVVLDVRYNPDTCLVTWGEIGLKAAKALYKKSKVKKDHFYKSLSGALIVGLYDSSKDILYPASSIAHWSDSLLLSYSAASHQVSEDNSNNNKRCQSSIIVNGRYTLLIQGPISRLSDDLLRMTIIPFINNPYEINALLRVSKRFLRVFLSDETWKLIHYKPSIWQGFSSGIISESIYWDKIAAESGLPISCKNRLQWYSHNTSKLKLLYGSIAPAEDSTEKKRVAMKTVSSLRNYFLYFTSSLTSTSTGTTTLSSEIATISSTKTNFTIKSCLVSKVIVIVSLDDVPFEANASLLKECIAEKLQSKSRCVEKMSLGEYVMRSLHFLVPSSATAFHLLNPDPLLPNAKLLFKEPSPLRARSRVHSQDPGTLVESLDVKPLAETSTERDIIYRRLGDQRLTFIQFQSFDIFSEGFESIPLQFIMKSSNLGYVLLLQADDTHVMMKLEATLLQLCRRCSQDILIMVGFRTTGDQKRESEREGWSDFIAFIVEGITEVASRVIDCNTSSSARLVGSWYVQPFNASASEGDLKQGFMTGFNWLARRHLKRNE